MQRVLTIRGRVRAAVQGLLVPVLNSAGLIINDEDIECLSLLRDEHINLLGRYHFTLDESIQKGEM